MKSNEDLSEVVEEKNYLNEEERKLLIEVLKMQIFATPIGYDKIIRIKKISNWKIDNKGKLINEKNNDLFDIVSTQLYYSDVDSDMSDFAVGFYEKLYQGILKKGAISKEKILEENGYFTNKNFAGDTINSFNKIANLTENAGQSVKCRTPYENWPEELQNLHDKYHCLANFWMIPMEIGRKRGSDQRGNEPMNDYIDKYLNFIKPLWNIPRNSEYEEYEEYYNKFEDYFSMFDSFDDFCKKHYIPIKFIPNSDEKNPKIVINQMINFIDKRAELIADGDKARDLFDYFKELGLVD